MISDVYFPRITGVSTSIRIFRRELAARGHTVDLIAPAYPSANCGETGVERIPSRYLVVDPEDRMMIGRAIRRLQPALERRRYDLVHIQTPFVAHYAGLRLAAKLGTPVVASYHTYFEEYFSHYLPWLPRVWLQYAARRFSRSQCNAVDAVVVPSKPIHDLLHRYGVYTPIKVIPTGIERQWLAAGDGLGFRRRHGIQPQRPLLLTVGRVAHEKNIDFLLQMLVLVRRQWPDVLLLIAGDGPARPHLTELARRLGIQNNVLFLGYLEREHELPDCYLAADVFVFASRTETQGLVLLEALLAGTPVVATAHLGTAEILAPRRGALVAADDVADFAAQVLRLLNDPALRRTLSRDAQDHAQTWSAPALAGELESLYRDVSQAAVSQGG